MQNSPIKDEEPKFVIMTASIFPIQKEELERISEATSRSVSDLIREAVTVLISNYKR